jgi:putative adenylate-forming enzyme
MPYRFQKLEFRKWQDRCAKEIVQYAFLHSPFYFNLYKNFDIKKWKELPIIDNKIMMNHFSEFNTKGVTRDEALFSTMDTAKHQEFKHRHKEINVISSPGTSGVQSLFLMNSFEESRWVGSFLAKAIPPSFRSQHKIALFMRKNSSFYDSLQNNKIQIKYFDMVSSVRNSILELEKFRPSIIIAPPSILRSIAFLKKEMRLRLQPKKIFSVAEVLEPIDQAFIENVFETKLHQIYQATEGFLGITCSHNVMHLNEDLLIFEDEDLGQDRFTPIITDLYGELQPLIRYRLGDVLIRGENNCPCGSYYRTVEKIECRKEDVFIFYDIYKNKRVLLYPEYIRETLVLFADQIEEYIFTQNYANHLKLNLKIKPEIDRIILEEDIQKCFEILFKQFNISPIQLEIAYGSTKNLPLAKVRRFERQFEDFNNI